MKIAVMLLLQSREWPTFLCVAYILAVLPAMILRGLPIALPAAAARERSCQISLHNRQTSLQTGDTFKQNQFRVSPL